MNSGGKPVSFELLEVFEEEEESVGGAYVPSMVVGCPVADVRYRVKLRSFPIPVGGYIAVKVSSSSDSSVNSGDVKTFPTRGSLSQFSNSMPANTVAQRYNDQRR